MRAHRNAEPAAAPPRASFGHVVKKLLPGKPGTSGQQARFGDALVCVRYRSSPETGRQYTTVEIVVAERAARPTVGPAIVAVRIDYHEAELRSRAKQAGARWDPKARAWRMPRNVARSLGLRNRILKEIA